MGNLDSYTLIIGASAIIILSYLFNVIGKRTNIPSVLLLIFTGLGINQGMKAMGFVNIDLFPILEILGIVGLILIVLEAALDLKLERSKLPLILKSFFVALVLLLVTSFVCAFFIYNSLGIPYYNALIYAVPISIMSSAITIPSVGNLIPEKKEFMIYESTFSDILGIIMFYFLIDGNKPSNAYQMSFNLFGNILLTIICAFILSLALIWVLQRITTRLKLFLSFAILLLIYSIGKLMHLSSLIFILIFGLVLNNHEIFIKGKLKRFIKKRFLLRILQDFKFMTGETAFVVRTFFFVIFGMSIALETLDNYIIYEISLLVILSMYLIRYLNLRMVLKSRIFPELYIAPRGLITILLFFSIPAEYHVSKFDSGILLVIILASSIIMMIALIASGNKIETEEEDEDSPLGLLS
ncbi:MAG: cell volume regulation protein A [Sphingobacteriales bacterium]|jgi:cell volume regulation protein A